MKKTFISILAGLMVIGSASALPTPEDRQALCDKFPEKFVWVEKTQACIPVNPCASDTNHQIRWRYCLHTEIPPIEESQIKQVMERYLKTRNQTLQNIKRLNDEGPLEYYSITTTDGGYYAFGVDDLIPEDFYWLSKIAVWAVGDNWSCERVDGTEKEIRCITGSEEKARNICRDVADFASLLIGEVVTSSLVEGKAGEMTYCFINK